MRCERMSATISVATCLARQRQGRKSIYEGGPLECRNCVQGRLAAAGNYGDEDVIAVKQAEESRARALAPTPDRDAALATAPTAGKEVVELMGKVLASPASKEAGAPARLVLASKEDGRKGPWSPNRRRRHSEAMRKCHERWRGGKTRLPASADPLPAPMERATEPDPGMEEIEITDKHIILDFRGRAKLLKNVRVLAAVAKISQEEAARRLIAVGAAAMLTLGGTRRQR
jgi:hypothetical protein